MIHIIKSKYFQAFTFTFLVLVVILLPLFLRYNSSYPLFPNQDFYYQEMLINDLAVGNFVDPIQGVVYESSFVFYLLSALNLSNNYLIILSLILAFLSLITFLLILKFFVKDELVVFFSVCLFALSPIFINLFTVLTPLSFAVVFSLLFVYFFLSKNNLSIVFLVLVSVTHFSFFIFLLFLLIIYYLYVNDLRKFLINIIPSLIFFLSFYFFHKSFFIPDFFSSPSLSEFFTSFGAPMGLSFFYVFLGFMSFFNHTNRGRQRLFFFVFLFLPALLAFFNNVSSKIFFNFFLCFLVSEIIVLFLQKKWSLLILKKATLLLIFCVVLFSATLNISELVKANPTSDLYLALNFLSFEDYGTVFSHQSYGHFIQYFSGMKSFTDDKSFLKDDYLVMKDFEQSIFYSRNLDQTEDLIESLNLKYFLITPEMKIGLVWTREFEGLLFLLYNTDVFSKIYDFDGFEIWRYG